MGYLWVALGCLVIGVSVAFIAYKVNMQMVKDRLEADKILKEIFPLGGMSERDVPLVIVEALPEDY